LEVGAKAVQDVFRGQDYLAAYRARPQFGLYGNGALAIIKQEIYLKALRQI